MAPQEESENQKPTKAEGKFPKGKSGNPAGRPKGSKNKITVQKQMLEEAFRSDQASRIRRVLETVVDQALQGDRTSQALIWNSAISKNVPTEDKDNKPQAAIHITYSQGPERPTEVRGEIIEAEEVAKDVEEDSRRPSGPADGSGRESDGSGGSGAE